MAVDESHPNVVRFDRKLWVSPIPSDELAAQITAQRAWDVEKSRVNRWPLAIGLGAAVGTAVIYVVGSLLGAPPVVNLFILPLGFGAGAVLGAVVSERMRPSRPADAALGPRPTTAVMTRLPRHVTAQADPDSTAQELIDLATARKR